MLVSFAVSGTAASPVVLEVVMVPDKCTSPALANSMDFLIVLAEAARHSMSLQPPSFHGNQLHASRDHSVV